ncbi:16S rRNA (uracil(1498)-N(3))-methyltransferase [Rothia sp. P13129]|uniref:16S rRNA (uracil(1498)-N(3))-methyltransferase n=1 Tax=unclassified Rothia (in: high G+C Gram-positive bacteria) TaxID=2689056 RepID=UPI003AC0B118
MTSPIFYVSSDELQSATPGQLIAVQGVEGHHAKVVKRLEIGEAIDLADGRGIRAHAEVASYLDDGLEVRVDTIVREELSTEIILVQALAKQDRDILAIETATELGIGGVIPWSADRSIVRWKKERAAKAHAKWSNTVRAAAKQARRSWVPQIENLVSSRELAKYLTEEIAQGALAIILHEQGTLSLTQYLNDSENLPQRIYLVVGPEGGISAQELEAFENAGATVCLLGEHVLRSSTAGSAALCVINTLSKAW